MLTRTGLKCDCCGRFISTDDLATGRAVHKLLEPDSPFTRETWDTYHVKCDVDRLERKYTE